jgi:CPA2 family monovalent cation:H+ antiporter-2
MLVDPKVIASEASFLLILIPIIILVKIFSGIFSTLIVGYPLKIGLMVGIYLSQLGEFSFMVATVAFKSEIIGLQEYNTFLSVAVISMIISPFIVASSEKILNILIRNLHIEKFLSLSLGKNQITTSKKEKLSHHLVIIGYGFTGKNLARIAKDSNIPYVIIEINPETVRKEKRKEPIFYGEATREEIIRHANVQEAKVVAIAIPDPVATRRLVELIKRISPFAKLVLRNRFVGEHDRFKSLGADEVVTEEFESALAIMRAVMEHLGIPEEGIELFLSRVRTSNYEFFKRPEITIRNLCDLSSTLPDLEIRTFTVEEGSHFANKSIRELDFRKNYGVTILAVKSKGEFDPNPSPDLVLLPGDTLVLVAGKRQLKEFPRQGTTMAGDKA